MMGTSKVCTSLFVPRRLRSYSVRRSIRTLSGVVAGVVATVALGASQVLAYSAVILDNLPSGGSNTAYGVNNFQPTNFAFLVVGVNYNQGSQSPVYWDSTGTAHALPLPTGSGGGVARGVNKNGIIVGWIANPSGEQHAALWSPSTTGGYNSPVDMGTLGGNSSIAYGINEAGDVVGDSTLTGNTVHRGFIDPAGSVGMTDLGTVQGSSTSFSTARAINNNGVIVGGSIGTNGYTCSCAWTYSTSGGLTVNTPTSFGILAGPPGRHGFTQTANAVNDFGLSSLVAVGIGTKSNLVNESTGVGDGPSGHDGTKWTQSGGSVKLNFSGAVRQMEATGVNDAGRIIGNCSGNVSPWYASYTDDNSTFYSLPDPTFGDDGTEAFAINNYNVIVGDASGQAVYWY